MSDRAAGIQPRPNEAIPQVSSPAHHRPSLEPLIIVDESAVVAGPTDNTDISRQSGFEASSSTLVGDLGLNDIQLLVAPSSDNPLGESPGEGPAEDEEDSEKSELKERAERPFYRRPSAWWSVQSYSYWATMSFTQFARMIAAQDVRDISICFRRIRNNYCSSH
jgi:hypothetical protein